MTGGGGGRARIGIDVGGTKIEIIALDAGGVELARKRVPTPKDYESLLRTLRDLVAGVESRLGTTATIGIGCPGSLVPKTALWQNANMTFCNGQPLPRDIASLLAREIRIENDANCFALSEAVDGAGKDHRVVFAGTLGSGAGGGLVIDKRLHRGPNNLAGEWGHMPLPWPRSDEMPLARCFCGLLGCAEQYVSGTGLARDHFAATGERIKSEDIVARRQSGEPAAEATINRFLDRLARYLAVIMNAFDPDIFVLGGGLSALPDIYRAAPEIARAYTFGGAGVLNLAPARHGAASGVRGAAWLWS
jgi:fructokinase